LNRKSATVATPTLPLSLAANEKMGSSAISLIVWRSETMKIGYGQPFHQTNDLRGDTAASAKSTQRHVTCFDVHFCSGSGEVDETTCRQVEDATLVVQCIPCSVIGTAFRRELAEFIGKVVGCLVVGDRVDARLVA